MEKRKSVLTVALIFYATQVFAQAGDTPSVSFDGFGTLGMVHSDENKATLAPNIFVPKGAGYKNEWSAEVDSRLGLQLTANLTLRWSSVLQVIVEQDYNGHFTPDIEWANVKFDMTPELSLRAGRVVLPSFMNSEYRKVGYAIPWVRPPQEVYRTVPVSNLDGIDAAYRFRFDDFTNTVQATYGQADKAFTFADGTGGWSKGEARSRKGLTINNTLEHGGASFFAAYSQFRLSIDEFNPLFDIYRMFGPQGNAIANRYNLDDKRFEVLTLGASYDAGDWFLMGEWTQMESRSLITDTRSWYVTSGYRFGTITPYLTYSQQRTHNSPSNPGLGQPGTEELDAFLQSSLESQPRQESVSLGVRWDFTRNMALKAQYDHMNLDSGSPGFLVNTQPDFEPGGTVNLFSLALDFVF
ncbi:porin [Halomonas sp. SH5A2]|uniref:porin n=1 Tax=Halomonas sp. SH5A2 TaxID=2749040 RepID=UPI00163FCFAC|nr:porin [Halomonas sp. SH5A2]QNI02470.1 porin [Halomonas sp. SH5A2]